RAAVSKTASWGFESLLACQSENIQTFKKIIIMNAQVEEATSVSDIVKLLLSPVLIVLGVVGFYYFNDFQFLYRVVALFVIVAVSIVIMFTTAKGQSVLSFILESKQEFKRIVWPTRDEAVRTTLLVFVMVTIVGFMLWFLDMLFFSAVQFLMNQGVG
ncbi:MAG: preprotein translocase subunit SecE, partial [Methylomonas sp.]